jgi:hypothetical protein
MPSNIPDTIKDRAGQIFNKIDQINFIEIAVIAGLAWVLILLVERLVPRLANRLPARLRMYLLPSWVLPRWLWGLPSRITSAA